MFLNRALLTICFLVCFGCASKSDSANSKVAALSDYCAKCSECVVQPTFDEGFCTPFKQTSGSFDQLACTTQGDITQLKDHTLTVGKLDLMTCQQFDDAE